LSRARRPPGRKRRFVCRNAVLGERRLHLLTRRDENIGAHIERRRFLHGLQFVGKTITEISAQRLFIISGAFHAHGFGHIGMIERFTLETFEPCELIAGQRSRRKFRAVEQFLELVFACTVRQRGISNEQVARRVFHARALQPPGQAPPRAHDVIGPLGDVRAVFRPDIAALAHVIADDAIHRDFRSGDPFIDFDHGLYAGCWSHASVV
jgi:hypothetical protein